VIVQTTIIKAIPDHLASGAMEFLESMPHTGVVSKAIRYGDIIVVVRGSQSLEQDIIKRILEVYQKPPFIRRQYVFSKSEVEQAKMLAIGSDTAPLDEVETEFVRTDQTCRRCLSGSRVVSAHIRGPRKPKQHFMQTIQHDMIISADTARLLLEAGCPSSDLVPARWRGEDDQFYLISPERTVPRMSPQSEGVFVDEDHPCTVCNRRFSGLLTVPQLLRYDRAFLESLDKDECRFYWSWEYFGAWLEPENLNPQFASVGRPKLLATKKCCKILRAHCKRQVEAIPVFPDA
jgi:hypothetical protein